MSGAAASARSIIGDDEPVQLYRKDHSSHRPSSSSGYSSKSLSSEAYFGSGKKKQGRNIEKGQIPPRSPAEASLDAFFSDLPASEQATDTCSSVAMPENRNEDFSWGFGDRSASPSATLPQEKPAKQSKSIRSSTSKPSKVQSLNISNHDDGWGFGDNDLDDRKCSESHSPSGNDDDAWDDWD